GADRPHQKGERKNGPNVDVRVLIIRTEEMVLEGGGEHRIDIDVIPFDQIPGRPLDGVGNRAAQIAGLIGCVNAFHTVTSKRVPNADTLRCGGGNFPGICIDICQPGDGALTASSASTASAQIDVMKLVIPFCHCPEKPCYTRVPITGLASDCKAA